MILASILSLALSLYCYGISQLQQHGKLKWSRKEVPFAFWGENSDVRKNKYDGSGNKIGEKFFLSTTLLVFLTDGYHFMQFMFFNFLALGFTLAIGWNWLLFCSLMVGIRIVHWSARKALSK